MECTLVQWRLSIYPWGHRYFFLEIPGSLIRRFMSILQIHYWIILIRVHTYNVQIVTDSYKDVGILLLIYDRIQTVLLFPTKPVYTLDMHCISVRRNKVDEIYYYNNYQYVFLKWFPVFTIILFFINGTIDFSWHFVPYTYVIYTCKDAFQCRPWAPPPLSYTPSEPISKIFNFLESLGQMIMCGQLLFLNFENEDPFWVKKNALKKNQNMMGLSDTSKDAHL